MNSLSKAKATKREIMKNQPIARPETMPEPFWNSMSADQQAEVVRFEQLFGMVWPTGSRVICPSSVTPDSDWDIYALGEKRHSMDFLWDGYHGPKHNRVKAEDQSISLKKNGLNITIFYLEYELRKFHAATEFCIAMGGPETREKRIAAFQKFMRDYDEKDWKQMDYDYAGSAATGSSPDYDPPF